MENLNTGSVAIHGRCPATSAERTPEGPAAVNPLGGGWERPGDLDWRPCPRPESTSSVTARCTTPTVSSTVGSRASDSATSASRWRRVSRCVARRRRRRPTDRGLAAAAHAGVGGALGRGLRARGRPRRAPHRADEPLRGPAPGVHTKRSIGRPAEWPWIAKPFRPSWGEAYESIANRMLAAVRHGVGERDEGRRRPRQPPAAHLMVHRRLAGEHLWHDPPAASLRPLQHHDRSSVCRPRDRSLHRGRVRGPCRTAPGRPRSTKEQCEDHQQATRATVAATAVVAALALAGCSSSNDALTKQYGNGDDAELHPGQRRGDRGRRGRATDPISFDVKSM